MTFRKSAGVIAFMASAIMATSAFAESISTHVLDLATGTGGANIPVTLDYREHDGSWRQIATATTDENGRVRTFSNIAPDPGTYRLTFNLSDYRDLEQPNFFPEINVSFRVLDSSTSYHVPIVLSPFGYSTYRGN